MISPHPDVRSMTLNHRHKFIILACDGIWNSLSSQEACDFVAERMGKEEALSSICEEVSVCVGGGGVFGGGWLGCVYMVI